MEKKSFCYSGRVYLIAWTYIYSFEYDNVITNGLENLCIFFSFWKLLFFLIGKVTDNLSIFDHFKIGNEYEIYEDEEDEESGEKCICNHKIHKILIRITKKTW